jgi:ElaB/YqjD/DUF883 family membrane-anchored ribosome-binding protein
MVAQTGAGEGAATTISDTVEKASAAVNEAVETATRRGRAAAHDAEETWSNLDNAMRDFIRKKPYTALALAGAAGFLYAAIRRG